VASLGGVDAQEIQIAVYRVPKVVALGDVKYVGRVHEVRGARNNATNNELIGNDSDLRNENKDINKARMR
jgi:hypothetical protein